MRFIVYSRERWKEKRTINAGMRVRWNQTAIGAANSKTKVAHVISLIKIIDSNRKLGKGNL